MQAATPQTVLGNFAQSATNTGWRHVFSRRDDQFRVSIDAAQREQQAFDVRYTFGVYPLQQYLIPFPGGRLQVLDLAWDARERAQGGQRWFAPAAAASHVDPWAGRDQNWNGMCAACHSTGLHKGYDAANDVFDTSWAELDVACEACHGRGSQHVAWAEQAPPMRRTEDARGFEVSLRAASARRWQFSAGQKIAGADGARAAPILDRGAEVNRCLPCHARRQELTAEPIVAASVLDHYAPSLLDQGLYHADGQIDDEDFEYGSFVQSRMYLAGVTCSDCHDPHTAKLRASGNDLCGQCHAGEHYDRTEHHHHPLGSTSAQCVTCHMPSQIYMGVHSRRDHFIRIPRPDLSQLRAVPNPCSACHTAQGPAWAARQVVAWGAHPSSLETSYAHAIEAGRRGDSGANVLLASDELQRELAPIRRATALSLLRGPLAPEPRETLRRATRDPDGLVRLGAARALDALTPDERVELGRSLLDDPALAIRIEAARALADTPETRLDGPLRARLSETLREWIATRQTTAERPEAHVDVAQVYTRLGMLEDAERALRHALALDSASLPARINLADLQRSIGRDADAEVLLRETVRMHPDSAVAQHALGLTYVRLQRRAEALEGLRQACELAPREIDYVYAYAIALQEFGRSREARAVLTRAISAQPGETRLLALLRSVEAAPRAR
jgi:predicted CXXCH cytochrome family protein